MTLATEQANICQTTMDVEVSQIITTKKTKINKIEIVSA